MKITEGKTIEGKFVEYNSFDGTMPIKILSNSNDLLISRVYLSLDDAKIVLKELTEILGEIAK